MVRYWLENGSSPSVNGLWGGTVIIVEHWVGCRIHYENMNGKNWMEETMMLVPSALWEDDWNMKMGIGKMGELKGIRKPYLSLGIVLLYTSFKRGNLPKTQCMGHWKE